MYISKWLSNGNSSWSVHFLLITRIRYASKFQCLFGELCQMYISWQWRSVKTNFVGNFVEYIYLQLLTSYSRENGRTKFCTGKYLIDVLYLVSWWKNNWIFLYICIVFHVSACCANWPGNVNWLLDKSNHVIGHFVAEFDT